MITNITKQDQLKSAQGINLPILMAQYWYSKHPNLNFGVDLNHHLFEGHVLSNPNVFVMGKLIRVEDEIVFFIRFALGDLEEIGNSSVFITENVKSVAFCRNNEGNVKQWSIDRCKELSRIASLTSPIFSMNTKLEDGRFQSAA